MKYTLVIEIEAETGQGIADSLFDIAERIILNKNNSNLAINKTSKSFFKFNIDPKKC